MTYRLLYHPLVREEDVPRINKNLRSRLARAVEERLASEPQSYGKPLRGTLAGYWKLRVGDFRVVFRVVKAEVWIYAVIDRRDVYDEVLRRLKWKE